MLNSITIYFIIEIIKEVELSFLKEYQEAYQSYKRL